MVKLDGLIVSSEGAAGLYQFKIECDGVSVLIKNIQVV